MKRKDLGGGFEEITFEGDLYTDDDGTVRQLFGTMVYGDFGTLDLGVVRDETNAHRPDDHIFIEAPRLLVVEPRHDVGGPAVV